MSNPKDDKNFTPNQVGALVEELKSEFRTVAEMVQPIPARLGRVEERLEAVEGEMKLLKIAVQTALPDLNKRVAKLEVKVGA